MEKRDKRFERLDERAIQTVLLDEIASTLGETSSNLFVLEETKIIAADETKKQLILEMKKEIPPGQILYVRQLLIECASISDPCGYVTVIVDGKKVVDDHPDYGFQFFYYLWGHPDLAFTSDNKLEVWARNNGEITYVHASFAGVLVPYKKKKEGA